jgi:hypothetical protein
MSRAFTAAQYIENSAVPVSAPPFTISAWVRNTGSFANFPFIVTLYTASSTNNRHSLFVYNTGAIGAATRDAATTGDSITTALIADSNWHHAAGIWTSSSSRSSFLDGTSKNTDTTAITPSTPNRFSVGAWNAGANDGITGNIQEVAVWSVALDDNEIANLATGLCALRVRPQSLVVYLPVIGFSSPDIDIIGRFDMTVTGATVSGEEPRIVRPSSRKIFLPFAPGIINTVTLTDSLEPSDAMTWSALRNQFQLDAIIISDAVMQQMNRTVQTSDDLTLTDEQIVVRVLNRLMEDSALLLDETLRLYRWTIQTSDSLVMVDDLLASSTSIRIVIAVLESLMVMTDALQTMASLTREAGSMILMSDDVSSFAVRNREIIDSLMLLDSTLSQLQWNKILSDDMLLSDSLIALTSFFILYAGELAVIGADIPSIQLGVSNPSILLGGGRS